MSTGQRLLVTLTGALGGALFGSLSLDMVDLILDDGERLARPKAEGDAVSVEVQKRWFRVSHRLKLLGSQAAREAYDAYDTLVYQEIAHAIQKLLQPSADCHQAVCAMDARRSTTKGTEYTKESDGSFEKTGAPNRAVVSSRLSCFSCLSRLP
jgi:hypothetical protein